MKKNLFLLIVAMLAMPAMFAQPKNVARECVLFELMTGVHCGNCPAADEAIEEMLADGLLIAPVCYQAPSYSVPELTNDEVAARVSYYSAMGYPTLFMDGSISLPGGSPGMNYMYYQPYYEQEIAKTSPFTIAMDLESVGGVLYKVNCHVEQVGDCSGSDVRVFIVLTQSHIPYSWGGGEYVNWNVRDMIPTEQGTPFVGSSMDFSETFEIPYPLEDCQLVAWVQDYAGNKEVYQAVMMDVDVTPVYAETLTFDVDTLWINENWANLNVYNNTETDVVTLKKIIADDDMEWFTFECDGQEFGLDEEVSIEIPRGESVTLKVNLNVIAKEMKCPVLTFDNTLDPVSLVTAFDWVDAVDDNEKQMAQIFPNPSNGSFNLNLGEGQWDVEVYDITGRKVYEGRHEGQSAIDLGLCPMGMYFLKAKNESQEITSKMMVR
ncbi:MAG: T9SS type A sorting domain-containing protein [Bacteroidales bacterium]|nr:T9SS type A sorting domain-containing protein [Bacteroidales bacterium]